MKNYVVAYTDLLGALRQQDFRPEANVDLSLIPTSDESRAYEYGLKDYLAIKDPERFVCACVRKMTVDEDFLRYFPNLRMIQIVSAGYEKMDLEALRERGIQMANVRGLYSGHMAEDIVMRMIYLTRKMHIALAQQRRKEWRLIRPVGALENATVVFVGAGSIATEAVKRLAPFGMHIFGVARSDREQPGFEHVYAFENIAKVLPTADFIVCCLPESEDTDNLMSAEVFEYVKPGAIFVNVGRGTAVDEAALTKALAEGRIAAASSDVFASEPLSPDSPFWDMPNFVVTPHYSGGHYEGAGNQRRAFVAANISRFLLGEPIACRIV